MEKSSQIKWKCHETLSRAVTTATVGCSWKTLQKWVSEGAPVASRGGLTATGGPKEWRFHIGRLAQWFCRRELDKSHAARKEGKRYNGRRICLCCGHLRKVTEMHRDDYEICVSCDAMLKKHYVEIGLTEDSSVAA